MQKLISYSFVAGAFLITSCGMKEQKALTADQVHAIEDGVPKIIPTVTLINTRQSEDVSQVKIIIGDPAFYSADAGQKQQKAVAMGELVLKTAGPDNSLKNGVLVITKDVRNQAENPADGITVDMKLDSLNNVLFKK